jgi:hypothetical protein
MTGDWLGADEAPGESRQVLAHRLLRVAVVEKHLIGLGARLVKVQRGDVNDK